jgi:hypothetical protein
VTDILERIADPMRHFRCLSQQEQASAVIRLAKSGYTPHGISAATGLSLAQVLAVLSNVA